LTVSSLTGSAFGVEAGGELLDIERTPFVEIGPGSGTASDDTLSVDAVDLLGADVFPVATAGETGVGGFVESSAQVANVQIGDLSDDTGGGLLDLGGIVDDLLGGGGTLGLGGLFDDLFGGTLSADVIRSECESRLTFDDSPDTPGSRGETEVVGLEVLGDIVGDDGALLNLDDNPLVLALEDALDIDLALLRVVVNEQVENTDADSTEITVNALRLTILGDADTTDANAVDDDSLLDVIIAQSRCALNFGPIGTTSSTTNSSVPDGASSTTSTSMPDGPDGPDGPDDNDAHNDSDISNDSDGTAVIETGDANAVGNVSNTEINQTADAVGGGVDQDATVVNVGDAVANTGGNTAIGNNSTNVASNEQTAVAVGDGGTVNPCCNAADETDTASNTSSATNMSNGTAAISTGDANAAGNIAHTEINQTGNAAGGGGGSVPCGGTCKPEPCGECPADCESDPKPCDPTPCGDPCVGYDPCACWWDSWGRFGGSSSVNQSATVVNSGSANANTGGNTAIGNNSTNVVTNEQTAVATDD
jgi:hypothetical protein